MPIPFRPALLLSTLFLATNAPPVQAAESYDNCIGTISSLPTSITTQGVWCLKSDLTTSMADGAAITIDANNVTIDCNDFKVGGLGAGPGTDVVGVQIAGRANAVVRHCNLRGFATGIGGTGGGHVLEDNRIDGSTRIGIDITGPGSTVRRNFVLDTGGTTNSGYSSGVGIWVEDGVDVLDNTIAGVSPPGISAGSPVGINSIDNAGATIARNRISGLTPVGGQPAYGILEVTGGVILEGNQVTGPHFGLSYGVVCDLGTTTVVRNVLRGFSSAIGSNCFENGNVVNPN